MARAKPVPEDWPEAGVTMPMEAALADALPSGPDWQFEPKWDGFHCLAFRNGGAVELRAKSGKPLGRYFPEVVQRLEALAEKAFVLDGELVIARGGAVDFDALQLRLHPAESRVRKLARETPAELVVFDMLAHAEGSLIDTPLAERREALERFVAGLGDASGLRLSPCALDRAKAEAWLAGTGDALDGVIAKDRTAPYRAGERAMIKVKRLRTADCVVGGFRYAHGKKEVGSLLLGLYDDAGLLDHVGFTSSFGSEDRAALTRKLEKLVEEPGFTGKAPGGPSRWNSGRNSAFEPLKPELVVEVRYDHVTGARFRHGTKFLRWRPDKAPGQCRFGQLAPPANPEHLEQLLRRAERADNSISA